jgi:DMSO/TMAO reductase YedYZ molybdopterin-dependent catalytic subunit
MEMIPVSQSMSSHRARGTRPVLPPGQRAVVGFPRFGAHGRTPPPEVPADHRIEVTGPGVDAIALSLSDLDRLARHELTADHHCVAGWSAVSLRWSGFRWRDFHAAFVVPALRPDATVTHVVFTGLDSFRSIVRLEDLEGDRVLLADRLDGEPLTPEHGAPIRLVSADQYGFVSTKHLCRVELHEHEPAGHYHADHRVDRTLRLVRPHERARVWREERHRFLPPWLVRPVYRLLVRLPARPLEPND